MNEIATVRTDLNGEILPAGAALDKIPTTTLEDFQRDAFSTAASRFGMASMREGTSDTVMHVGQQLTSEDVANHVLTISYAGFASIPETDIQGNPVYDENGNQKTAVYPVCRFKEAPTMWYNGGTMLRKNIEAWCREVGDDMTDHNLPVLNRALEECGGVRIFFAWKNKRGTSGQRYISMIVA